MIPFVKTLDKVLDFIEIYVNGILLLGMCAIIFLQVVFRHAGLPVIWTEEIALFLFVWIIYISTSKAIKAKRHLSIDILPLFLGKKGNIILRLVSDFFGLAFFCIIFYYGMQVITTFFNKPQYSQATHTNMIIAYMAPYFGSFIAAIRYIQDMLLAVKEFRGGTPDEKEEIA